MGIHYFASREADDRGPLTWPEGNGWIARRLIDRFKIRIRGNQPVLHIMPDGRHLKVLTPDTLIHTEAVIFAAPSFLAPHVIEGVRPVDTAYSPWVTANVTLDRMPAEQGFGAAWDNVIPGSPSLGYVVATHMNLRTHNERSVWTWYHALADSDVRAARTSLLQSTWDDWKEFILKDLSRAHPDIRDCVARIDIMRFGHAMARPIPGSVFSPSRTQPRSGTPGVFLANSDLSGYSIFEEAQSRGVRAAAEVLRRIGR
jgi:glycine/D-amino acid oxidase-like deaminating enzyme